MVDVGDKIERYVVESILGSGAVATVYKVRHQDLGAPYALKLVQVGNEATRERLLAEGRAQAQLVHPNVVRVTDVVRVDGVPALVLEFVDGPSLDENLKGSKPELSEALFLFRGIARGVGAAHRKNIIHRDLKPANVLVALTDEGIVPKVTDFGLVKVLAHSGGSGPSTRGGASMGTPAYMSPEQAVDASSVDHRADIWSLGVILYELVCGERPFQGHGMVAVLNAVAAGRYVDPLQLTPDLPKHIVKAIDKMLRVDPAERYASVDDLLDTLFDEDTTGIKRRQSLRVSMFDDPTTDTQIPRLLRKATPTPTNAPQGRAAHAMLEIAGAGLFVAAAVSSLIATVILRG